jgi:hypothetical protein
MKEYNVVLRYSVRVEAEDEDTAKSTAWSLFGEANPRIVDNFSCTAEPIADPWDTDERGKYTCVDCEELFSEESIFGNREYSYPRCEDCYDTHRYSA